MALNERGTWQNPPPEDDTKRARQDEEIFQTARLIKYVFKATAPLGRSVSWLVFLQLR